MSDGLTGTVLLVDADRQHAGGLGNRRRAHRNHGHRDVHQVDVLGHLDQGCHDDHRLDGKPQEMIDRAAQGFGCGDVERCDAGEIAGLPGRQFDGQQDRRGSVMDRGRRDDPDDARLAGDQRPGHRVATISEVFDRLVDAIARLGRDLVAPVQDARDGLVRDAGGGGDVHHRGWSLGRACAHGDDSFCRSAAWRSDSAAPVYA